MKFASTALAAVGLTCAAVLGLAAGPVNATDASTATTTAELPPYAVDYMAYPDADRIFAETGVRLKKGNGRITLAECGSAPGQLTVRSRDVPQFCLNVTGTHGYLSLEVPAVNGVRGNDYDTQVSMTVEDEKKSFAIRKNEWTGVGEVTEPEERDHTLVEIITSR